jgi:hypothetical protein
LAVISAGSACADDTPATTIDFGDGGTATSTSGATEITSFGLELGFERCRDHDG